MSDERTFTQEEVDQIVGRTRLEARDRAERDIKDELLVAKEHEDQIVELKEQVGLYRDKYTEIMQTTFDVMVSELSEEVKEMVSDLPGDVSDKIAWLKTHKDTLKIKQGDGVGNRSVDPSNTNPPKSGYHRRGARKE